jgi:hypothetical protein
MKLSLRRLLSISGLMAAPALVLLLAGCCSVGDSHYAHITYASIELRGISLNRSDLKTVNAALKKWGSGQDAMIYQIKEYANGVPAGVVLGEMKDLDVGPDLIKNIACLAKPGFSAWTTRIGLTRLVPRSTRSTRSCSTHFCPNAASDRLVEEVGPILAKYNKP